MRRVLVAVTAICLLVALAAPVSAGQQAPVRGLRLVTTLHSLIGTHRWYVQTYGGHDVLGSFYGVHSDLAGKTTSVNDGREAVSGAIPAGARVSAAAARTRATAPGAVASLVVLPGHARLVWRVIDDIGMQTLVDATTGAVVSRKSIARLDTGTGSVFDPNPVVTLRDEALTDHNDHNFAAILPAYKHVVLTNLDGSGHLYGDFAHVAGRHGPAYSADLRFDYQRGNPWFEQVMAYYDVTGAERYIQSLGFADVNNEPQNISADTFSGDNCFYDPRQGQDHVRQGRRRRRRGRRGDLARVRPRDPGRAGARLRRRPRGRVDRRGLRRLLGRHDERSRCRTGSTCRASRTGTRPRTRRRSPHCLRRTDTNLTTADENGEVHHDGQIWSRGAVGHPPRPRPRGDRHDHPRRRSSPSRRTPRSPPRRPCWCRPRSGCTAARHPAWCARRSSAEASCKRTCTGRTGDR